MVLEKMSETNEKALKIANARKKLKDHQNRKTVVKELPLDQQKIQSNDDIVYNGHDEAKIFPPQIEKSYDNCIQNHDNCIQNHDKNVTEILLQEKRTLEYNLSQLSQMFANLKSQYDVLENKYQTAKSTTLQLQSQLTLVQGRERDIADQLKYEKMQIETMKQQECFFNERNCDLEDKFQLSLRKMQELDNENQAVKSQLESLQAQLEFNQLQLRQINGEEFLKRQSSATNNKTVMTNESLDEMSKLEKLIKDLKNEKKDLIEHFQQHVDQLNEQLKSLQNMNERLMNENEYLLSREQGLVEQMQDIEKQLQTFYTKERILNECKEAVATVDNSTETDAESERKHYEALLADKDCELQTFRKTVEEKDFKLIELKEIIHKIENEKLDVTKFLSASESDKIAAQRATTQNKKLKIELQELQDAFVKMSQEKLFLTEKVEAEKFLNRELTLKLADIDENYKGVATKLKSKDDEMIRLQSLCSEWEEKINEMKIEVLNKHKCPGHAPQSENVDERSSETSLHIATEDALVKLESRFTTLMREVAELSDEKKKLEHLVSQLQSETETIGEYVALYQQQRGVLKQREAEREAQVKYLSTERDNLKKQLKCLRDISDGIEVTNTRAEMKNIISQIEQNHLIEPNRNCAMEKFHPCPWCSGKLIDV